MSRPARTFASLFTMTLALASSGSVRAGALSQTATLPLTSTDFGPNNTNVSAVDPLTFSQFNTHGGALVLDSITVKLSAALQNKFGMTFTTPATITDSVATSDASPAITKGMTNPGPAITIFQPNGTTPILTVAEPNDPSILKRSVTYSPAAGTSQQFSSLLAANSPYYIAPTNSTNSSSLTLKSPASLALFTGTGKLSLPVSASAVSTTTISSGNGAGWITTQGTATATISYTYHSKIPAGETVPEPTTILLWGIGGLAAFGLNRFRRKSA